MQHITLQTGHVVTQVRSAIRHNGIIEELKTMLDPSRHHRLRAPFQGYRLVWFVEQPGGPSNIFGVTTDELYATAPQACPTLVTCGIADTADLAVTTWNNLLLMNPENAHRPAERRVQWPRAVRPDSLPWLAVSISPLLRFDLDAATWLGDFERCVAWAWLESRQGIHTPNEAARDARWDLLLQP